MSNSCKKHGTNTTFYIDKRGIPRCRKCNVEQVQRRRVKIKKLAVEYKGGSCEICGYNKYIGALEFHHKDPTQKDFSISRKGHTIAWSKVKKEIDKCQLLCANCHRELHCK